MIDILSWFAIPVLSAGYFTQVYHIHKHKEVRDLSLPMYLLLCTGFTIMGLKAIQDGSWTFAVKQLMTLIPCAIISYQIVVHRKDEWKD
jgi:uncharacterized protein with PQ loop repeat